jgi:hypothetical protein
VLRKYAKRHVVGMVKKELIFCTVLVLIGTLDWLTTIVGIVFFGATENNPLLANFTETNMLLFSAVKLTAITITGLIFYKAGTQTKLSSEISPFAKKFLKSGYVISLFALSAVVLNNFSVIAKLA